MSNNPQKTLQRAGRSKFWEKKMNYPRGGGFQKKEKIIIISENVEGSDNAEWPSCKAFSLYQSLD